MATKVLVSSFFKQVKLGQKFYEHNDSTGPLHYKLSFDLMDAKFERAGEFNAVNTSTGDPVNFKGSDSVYVEEL